MLSLTLGPTVIPATLTTNNSPIPASNINSGTTLESEQLSTQA